jgi:enamine deaminase RidA (YjgF/YER057c/UK114 family)
MGNAMPFAKGTAIRRAKGFVFLSGVVGEDSKTGRIPFSIGAQTKLALE